MVKMSELLAEKLQNETVAEFCDKIANTFSSGDLQAINGLQKELLSFKHIPERVALRLFISHLRLVEIGHGMFEETDTDYEFGSNQGLAGVVITKISKKDLGRYVRTISNMQRIIARLQRDGL